LEFPFNIFATAAASDFKFGMQLGFFKARHKVTPRGKVGVEFPFNIFATAEPSDFKFVMQFGVFKAHHKFTPRGKMGVTMG